MSLDEMITKEQELREKIAKLTKEADKIKGEIEKKIAPYIQPTIVKEIVKEPYYPITPYNPARPWGDGSWVITY